VVKRCAFFQAGRIAKLGQLRESNDYRYCRQHVGADNPAFGGGPRLMLDKTFVEVKDHQQPKLVLALDEAAKALGR